MTSHTDRLRSLEQIERDIASALENAAWAIQELGKDKPNQKSAENHTNSFLKTINSVEVNLVKQISYLSQVSTGHLHTGSCYGAHKDWQMAKQRLDLVQTRLDDLEKLRHDQQAALRQSDLRRSLSHQSASLTSSFDNK